MAVNTMAVAATTGAPTVIGVATFTLLGVEIPTMSFLVAVAFSVIVRLYVNRKSAKKRITATDNLMLSSISLIVSVGIVIEYQLSFFHSIIVSGGISFAGEAVIVAMGDQMVAFVKDFFVILKSRIGISSSSSTTPAVPTPAPKPKPAIASKTPVDALSEPSEPESTPSTPEPSEA